LPFGVKLACAVRAPAGEPQPVPGEQVIGDVAEL